MSFDWIRSYTRNYVHIPHLLEVILFWDEITIVNNIKYGIYIQLNELCKRKLVNNLLKLNLVGILKNYAKRFDACILEKSHTYAQEKKNLHFYSANTLNLDVSTVSKYRRYHTTWSSSPTNEIKPPLFFKTKLFISDGVLWTGLYPTQMEELLWVFLKSAVKTPRSKELWTTLQTQAKNRCFFCLL